MWPAAAVEAQMKRSAYAGLFMLMLAFPAQASSFTSESEAKVGEHDLTGMWRIDLAHSQEPKPQYVDVLRAEMEGDSSGGVWFLPGVFRIGTSDNGLALSDSTGTILQVVMYMEVAEGDGGRMPPRFYGTWKHDRLMVVRPGRTGTMLKQTFSLENKATRLVVTTKMHREGASDFQVKRVYVRAPAS
jgi:hypothetical protein